MAVLIIFLPKKYYLYGALFAILVFHFLLSVIPYENGWDFDTLMYTDFWTMQGFLRNTFYNGWNSISPGSPITLLECIWVEWTGNYRA